MFSFIHHLKSAELNRKTMRLLYLFCLFLLLGDKAVMLFKFGFQYADLDQSVMWNAAWNYSNGLFHEPFFYGQNYNYMLEAFLAVPLLWLGVPVWIALPLITSLLILLPFVVLSRWLWKNNYLWWAMFALLFPVFLPWQFNLLTVLSRGFVQAFLFFPLLIPALFKPQQLGAWRLFYFGSAGAIVMNTGAVLLVGPLALWLWLQNFKNYRFYLQVIWSLPLLILHYFTTQFYVWHPEFNRFPLNGLEMNMATLKANFSNPNVLEYLFPIRAAWGWMYALLLPALAIYTLIRKKYLAFILILASCALLILSLSLAKTTIRMDYCWVFFTPSRLFLALPLLTVLLCWFSLKHISIPSWVFLLLILIGSAYMIRKTLVLDAGLKELLGSTIFAVDRTDKLVAQARLTHKIVKQTNADLILNVHNWVYEPIFLNYDYYPINQCHEPLICINRQERRTWQFEQLTHGHFERVLLFRPDIHPDSLRGFNYRYIHQDYLFINNTTLSLDSLMKRLGKPISAY